MSSRFERLLQAILNGETVDATPLSRNEELLSAIANRKVLGIKPSSGSQTPAEAMLLAVAEAAEEASRTVVQPLTITENGTYTAPEGVDGYNPVVVNVDTSKTWLLKTQGFSGFTANASYDGAYTKNLAFGTDIEAFQITERQKYIVVWDGTEYETKAEDISTIIPGALMLGNGSAFGLSGNGEPFIVGYGEFGLTLICLTDTEESHTLGIYQKVSAGSCDELKYVTFMSYDGTVEYGKKAVAAGDDCADPIARGLFDTPTRESDAQYNYTFYGWATTPNGAADSSALKAVNEDRTVYANFSKAVRYYTITYYDSDGTTVLKTESLAYGSMPSYSPGLENFGGWEPELTEVTGDASYQMVISEIDPNLVVPEISFSGSFANNDNAIVYEQADAGLIDTITVGEKYIVTFDGTERTETCYDCTFTLSNGSQNTLRGLGDSARKDTINGVHVTSRTQNLGYNSPYYITLYSKKLKIIVSNYEKHTIKIKKKA